MRSRTQELTQALRENGHRVTPQRQAICQLLAETKEHPSAQMIYAQLESEFASLSLATVYNTLETLVNLEEVYKLGSAGGEAERYDADTTPHVNLACTICNRVIDLPSSHVKELDQEVTENSGYRIQGARVMYYGICPDCQRIRERKESG